MNEAHDRGHIQRTHRALTEALRRVDSVCKELGVTYWVDGGTLLGAVRHHGPIPWDDDVDLGMSREELDRFVRHASELLGPRYSLQTPKDDPAIAVAAKIYINGTHIRSKFAEANGLPATQHDGLYIDVAIMDPISRFAAVRRFDRGLAWLVRVRPWARQMAASPTINSSKARVRWILASYVPLAAVGAARRWLDWRAARRDGGLIGVDVAGLFNGWPYPKEVIFPLSEETFAGLTVPVPADPHAYLIGEYGDDYMTLPPEDKRVTHTDDVLFDD
jgi:lipopolysaccharide cholinephosphotransferase